MTHGKIICGSTHCVFFVERFDNPFTVYGRIVSGFLLQLNVTDVLNLDDGFQDLDLSSLGKSKDFGRIPDTLGFGLTRNVERFDSDSLLGFGFELLGKSNNGSDTLGFGFEITGKIKEI